MGFFIGLLIGWLVGVIMTAFLLAKKNLERYNKASAVVEDKLKESTGMAKAAFEYYKKSPAEREAEERAKAEAENEDNSEE